MYIVSVIPIKKGFHRNEYLSYFSSIHLSVGDIVLIPIKTKNIDAIVVDIEEVAVNKSNIKNADYQLKKIIKLKGKSPFNQNFFTACLKIKDYTLGNINQVIKNLLPSVFLSNISLISLSDNTLKINNNNFYNEKFIFQASLEDRLSYYKVFIRESFAKKESVFICLPTNNDVLYFYNELSKCILNYSFVFNSDLSNKKMIDTYNQSIKEKHPVVIFGTGLYLSIPRNDIGTYILEKESSSLYKQILRPYIDIRSFIEILAFVNKSKLIISDSFLRTETLYRHEMNEFESVIPLTFRSKINANTTLIDMNDEVSLDNKKIFKLLSSNTKKIIEQSILKNKSIFLLVLRKGLAPITICNDCGNTLLCPNCKNPLVLYKIKKRIKNKDERIFICNKCHFKEKSLITCPYCMSWNLIPLGIGIDKIFDEIKSIFPDSLLYQLDKDSVKNKKEAKLIINNFLKDKGSILIGTEISLNYLNEFVDNSVIVSIDGLLSISNFNINQKIYNIIEKIANYTKDNLLIQTRINNNKVLENIVNNNILSLYKEDLLDRKNFNYPPFKMLIKIIFIGNLKETDNAVSYIKELLNKYNPQVYNISGGKVSNKYIMNTILKIDQDKWQLPVSDKYHIDIDLSEKLLALPPSFYINVDPIDIK